MFLDKHYNDFGGLDTRSNKLKQPPDSVRRGSKNFKYNFQDELTAANGFQHKSSALSSVAITDIEYKYKDLNTGESKSEMLTVCRDGNLYRKTGHFLKFTALNGLTSYSLIYNEATSLWNFIAYVGTTPTTYAFSATVDMDTLRSNINSLTGATCVVVNDLGATVTSTRKAYLLDVIIGRDLELNEVIREASAYDYTLVDCPNADFATGNDLPFPITQEFYASDEYEGISYVNLNNVCYITDGGFPMKYDGFQIYRVGMPRMLTGTNSVFGASSLTSFINFSGFSVDGVKVFSSATHLTTGTYKYLLQYGFVDSNGAENVGAIENGEAGCLTQVISVDNAVDITQDIIYPGAGFPVWACRVDGHQNLTSAGGTITVGIGHNIKVGMLLRIPISNESRVRDGFSYIMAYVSAVTATTVTVDYGVDPDVSAPYQKVYPFQDITAIKTGVTISSGTNTITNVAGVNSDLVGYYVIDPLFSFGTTVTGVAGITVTVSTNATGSVVGGDVEFLQVPYLLKDGSFLQGGYAADIYKNTITDIITGAEYSPKISFGAFVRIYRTKVDSDVFYKVFDVPVSYSGFADTITDCIADSKLTIAYSDSAQGGELPRACKYLATWQNQIIQAGRPVDPSVADDNYPSLTAVGGDPQNQWGVDPTTYFGYLYSEAGICDFQSWYWSDVNNPEGFPTSGLYEMAVDSAINDKIKGLGTNKDALFVFKYRTTAIATGSLAVGELTQEIFEEDIGLANHRTIQNVEGSLVWLDPINGFYSCIAGRLPSNIGYSIQDEFKLNPDDLNFNNSFAQNFEKENLYMCVVDNKMFLLDYAKTSNTTARGSWYQWDSLSAVSLLVDANEDCYLNDGSKLWKMKTTGTKYDYSNHTSAIDFRYFTAWLTYGTPTIDKHFVRVWISSIQGGFDLTISQYGNFNELGAIGDLVLSFVAESSSKLAIKDYMKACEPKLSGISVGFTNSTIQQYIRIQGFEIELDQEYDSMEPKL